MPRRLLFVALAAALLATGAPALADHDGDDPSPPDPTHRLNALTPKPPGTHETIVLQYGPYVVHPGSDLTRADAEPVLHDMFVIAARPSVRLVDGSEPPDDIVHIHHAHWIKPNPDSSSYYDWFFGTGEERTRGGGWAYMQADTENWNAGVRYGIPMNAGEQMGFISMLHNKTSGPLTLWIEGRFEVIWGSRDEIRAATTSTEYPDGLDIHPLTPVLHGDTFQVPRTGGTFTYPLDLEADIGDSIQAGIGHIWTAPFDGTIVIGAGHLHPGGREVVVSNLGSPSAPCGEAWLADPDGDGIPGQVIQRIQAYYMEDVFPSEEFQMGITKLGWRAKIRAGDQIAINGSYDTTRYAYPDAMSFFGFYVDQEDVPEPGEECTATLINDDQASPADVVMSIPNRPWDDDAAEFCDIAGHPSCDIAIADPAKGEWTDTIHIAGFTYVPGDTNTWDTLKVPRVRAGAPLTIVNEDWFAGLVRHSITTCRAPCNGLYRANYPFHDGALDSGALGFTPVETYETSTDAPMVTLDTSGLAPGLYTYYCRLHPFMRGGFWLEAAA